jgi:hypothetical protein
MMRDRGSPRLKRRGWIAAAAAAAVVVVSAIFWPSQPRPGASVAVLFAPWLAHGAAVRAAALDGIHILGENETLNIVFVSADDMHALAGLYQAGAWSLIGLDRLQGCFGIPAFDALHGGKDTP